MVIPDEFGITGGLRDLDVGCESKRLGRTLGGMEKSVLGCLSYVGVFAAYGKFLSRQGCREAADG